MSYNDLYNIHIQHPTTGRLYRYDPDHDCFYPVKSWDNATWVARYGWIIWCLLLTAVAFAICLNTDPQLAAWVRSLHQP